jgi:hypothetical protein
MLPDDISDKLKWQAQQLLDKVSMWMGSRYEEIYCWR